MRTERRTLLKILSAGALATPSGLEAAALCSGTAASSELGNYQFVFFTAEEQALLGELMEMIIPADEHSPGAKGARVPAFADLMISTGTERSRAAWRSGLAAFGAAGKGERLEVVLAQAAAEEGRPQTDLGRFFVDLKRMTVDGYYTSNVGILQEMGYVGNQHLKAAPGCEHGEHQG